MKFLNTQINVSESGEVTNSRSGEKIKPRKKKSGYRICFVENGKYKSFDLAYLVLDTFVSPADENCVGFIFKDGDKFNCHYSNLEWDKVEFNLYDNIPEFPGYFISKNGEVFSRKNSNSGLKWKRIEVFTTKKNRKTVVLYHKKNRPKPIFVHRLVLATYDGECPNGMECCHNDGDSSNNNLDNLRWDTRKSNIQDKFKHDSVVNGEKVKHLSKLKSQDIGKIFQLRRDGKKVVEIADLFKISKSVIYKILNGKLWNISAKKDNLNREKTWGHDSIILNEMDVIEIFKQSKNGISRQVLSDRFRVSRSSIDSILCSRNWKHVVVPDEYLTNKQKEMRNLILAAKGI